MRVCIARYKEDIRWVNELKCTFTVLDKETEGNWGRESSSYIKFILDNYENLEGDYVFCQGNPFEHDKDFLSNLNTKKYFGSVLESDAKGCPSHCGLPISETASRLGIAQDKYTFVAGAQFKVSAENIKARPKEFYQKCLEILKDDVQAYVFERLWLIIFNI